MTNDKNAIDTLMRRIYDAWAAGDADAFADCYTADATVVMPGVRHDGRDELRAYMAAAFAGPLRGSAGIDRPISTRALGETAALVISEAGILMAGETVLPDERKRIATWALVRQDEGWKVAAYHNCPA
ncbi:MAG TPA: SgcJ/EcaC family oxidoreductase [Stackebrandtia sp.]|jgi:uncharacterized protein (TIGR02246 family)|uniref:SgcJ/EcaC family oxidoreductase n=1 Tax=Stackebrandtia sp. TaxID=2023065 RepID=UPI002D6EF380|nr:SgcJ/EcaC family oxidoreductase [Stackebrandtia sp.]HZE38648.1 SgcJ/EcaC family oxidoreductase [Stackebrandtia sp.]